MVASEYYDCRLAVFDYTTNTWVDYRILKCTSFTYNTKNDVKVIHPLMLRAFSSGLETLLGMSTNALPYGKGMAPVIMDFTQWSNTFNITAFHSRSDKKMYQTLSEVNNLFTWVKRNQSAPTLIMYIQLFFNDADLTHVPKCALDPAKTVLGAFEGYGYQGVVTSMNISGLDAGKGSVNFTIDFQHGMVVPI